MTALNWIQNHGVEVSLEDAELVRLDGLDRLGPDDAALVVQFVKENKPVILDELRTAPSWRTLGSAEHPDSGERGELVQSPSGRFALDVGRHLLTVDQEWAEAMSARLPQ